MSGNPLEEDCSHGLKWVSQSSVLSVWRKWFTRICRYQSRASSNGRLRAREQLFGDDDTVDPKSHASDLVLGLLTNHGSISPVKPWSQIPRVRTPFEKIILFVDVQCGQDQMRYQATLVLVLPSSETIVKRIRLPLLVRH